MRDLQAGYYLSYQRANALVPSCTITSKYAFTLSTIVFSVDTIIFEKKKPVASVSFILFSIFKFLLCFGQVNSSHNNFCYRQKSISDGTTGLKFFRKLGFLPEAVSRIPLTFQRRCAESPSRVLYTRPDRYIAWFQGYVSNLRSSCYFFFVFARNLCT